MSEVPEVPRATYRLQLGGGFGFRDALRLVPYLHELGVSHVYASPYLAARAGSTHGYDIIDHNAFNPEVGGEDDFEDLVAELRRHGMGHILDFVPNHMGVARADNAWWLDVLEWGRASPYAEFFDIDWSPAKSDLRGKVLLPFLGDHYGRVLERGELRLAFDREHESFSVWYHEHRFPLAPRSYARILGDTHHAALARLAEGFRKLPRASERARVSPRMRQRALELRQELAEVVRTDPTAAAFVEHRIGELNGRPGDPRSFATLHELLEPQAYRLAYWRVAADEINYRRFFNVNELAGLRVELPEVFERVHGLVHRLIREGKLDGLRIDHVDGLYDPQAYCANLRALLGARPFYLVVEKILAVGERLRAEWPVDGTTGYEFLNLVNGLFVDPSAEGEMTRIYSTFIGREEDFEEIAYTCRKHVMNFLLGSELHVLANALDRISEAAWNTRDFTQTALKEALKEVVACFPVYRSYVGAGGASEEDRREIEQAVARARARSSDPEPTLFDFLHAVMTTDLAAQGYERAAVLRVAMKLQQFTGPVMAKALEDTAFYRYHRLASSCEVGGDPRRFGTGVSTFHRETCERSRALPHGMLATATHDTKRGEDVRARIDVLSELPAEWEAQVRRWSEHNRGQKALLDGRIAPTANDEYLFYQTLVGSWPPELAVGRPLEERHLEPYRKRIEAYMRKAVREAKQLSSWRQPNLPYETALAAFVRGTLTAGPGGFLGDLRGFQARVARLGAQNGLAQTLIRLTAPGVPDTYQGCELWDLSLVDPDNRRPVDYALRARLLSELRQGFETGTLDLDALLADWPDGRVKLFLSWRLLAFRRGHPALMRDGEYLPLEVTGARRDHLCAFARTRGEEALLVVAPRLLARLDDGGARLGVPPHAWEDTAVRCPPTPAARCWRDVVTDRRVEVLPGRPAALPASRLLAHFPVGAWEPVG